jgi:hypothetical protein
MSSDQLAEALEERIARLERLEEDFANEISRLKEVRDRVMHPDQRSAPKSQFLRVAEFLLSKGNRPRSAQMILKKTGVSRSSLSQMLHRTHKDSFISAPIPGYARKKLWSLTPAAATDAARLLQSQRVATLFGAEGDLSGVKGTDCCARILKEHDNEPMNALTLAREAISRGYHGKAQGSEDEVLLTTAKSFWAALGRDERFREIRPLVFALKTD